MGWKSGKGFYGWGSPSATKDLVTKAAKPITPVAFFRSMDSAKQFSNEKYISLETYKKNGDAVKSPVWVVEDGGVVYVRTNPASWKAKRIRKNPRVRIAASDMRGQVKGQWADGEARFIQGEEADRKIELFKKKYGAGLRFTDFFNGVRGRRATAIVSIELA